MTETLFWEPSSRHIWENWEEIARARLGLSTLTVLAADVSLQLTILNTNDKTRLKSEIDDAGIVVTRVTRTNINIIGTVEGSTYILLAIEPHPFMVESQY